MLREQGDLIPPPPSTVASPDPTDTAFVACAIAADAEFIVTGNNRHFPNSPYGRAHVVNAAELLDRITMGL